MPTASPSPSCLRDARAYARTCCADHPVSADRRDALELAVSELVGNAFRHGQPPVTYIVAPDNGDLLLTVTDGEPRPPGDGTCCVPDAESGRGLFLVDAVARDWGWEPAGTGKQVWARV